MSDAELAPEAFRPLQARHARRMGVNRLSALRTARELKRFGVIDSTMSREEIALAIATDMAADNVPEFEACMAEDGRDWEGFFQALIKFIEAIMPFILMFL